LRVERLAKNASSQLGSSKTRTYPGIFALGVTELQQVEDIAPILTKRFSQGQYSGISSVMMLRRGTVLEPPKRGSGDLIGTLPNARAKRRLPALGLQPLDLAGTFPTAEGGIPAYRYQVHEAKMGEAPFSVQINDLRTLTPAMLE
jgi:hypothetical protein